MASTSVSGSTTGLWQPAMQCGRAGAPIRADRHNQVARSPAAPRSSGASCWKLIKAAGLGAVGGLAVEAVGTVGTIAVVGAYAACTGTGFVTVLGGVIGQCACPIPVVGAVVGVALSALIGLGCQYVVSRSTKITNIPEGATPPEVHDLIGKDLQQRGLQRSESTKKAMTGADLQRRSSYAGCGSSVHVGIPRLNGKLSDIVIKYVMQGPLEEELAEDDNRIMAAKLLGEPKVLYLKVVRKGKSELHAVEAKSADAFIAKQKRKRARCILIAVEATRVIGLNGSKLLVEANWKLANAVLKHFKEDIPKVEQAGFCYGDICPHNLKVENFNEVAKDKSGTLEYSIVGFDFGGFRSFSKAKAEHQGSNCYVMPEVLGCKQGKKHEAGEYDARGSDHYSAAVTALAFAMPDVREGLDKYIDRQIGFKREHKLVPYLLEISKTTNGKERLNAILRIAARGSDESDSTMLDKWNKQLDEMPDLRSQLEQFLNRRFEITNQGT